MKYQLFIVIFLQLTVLCTVFAQNTRVKWVGTLDGNGGAIEEALNGSSSIQIEYSAINSDNFENANWGLEAGDSYNYSGGRFSAGYRHYLLHNDYKNCGFYAGLNFMFQNFTLHYFKQVETIMNGTPINIGLIFDDRVQTFGYKLDLGYQHDLKWFNIDGGFTFRTSYPTSLKRLELSDGTKLPFYSNVFGSMVMPYISFGVVF